MDVNDAIAEADRLRQEIDTIRPISSEQEARVFQKFRLDWNYHSNAIEGNSLTYGETKAFIMQGLTAKGKPFKDYLDIRGHNQVIDVLRDIVRRQEELTEAAIRELHKILLVEPYQSPSISPDGIPITRRIEIGQYKATPNHVQTATGQVHYFASPEETPAKMAELIRWYRSQRDNRAVHPIALATGFHHQFVSIHPFDDGNGRMARILMNLILMQHGYLPVILKTNRRSEYFLALEKADAGEMSDFIAFVAEALIESESLYLRAARGESIDELDDFDKRLRLLRQSVETETGGSEDQRTLAGQNSVIQRLLAGLFETLDAKFAQIGPLFAEKQLVILLKSDGVQSALSDKPMHQLIQDLVIASSDKQMSSVTLWYNARGFRKNSSLDLALFLTTYFNPKDFAVDLQATGLPKREIFRSAYSSVLGEAEKEQLAKTILDGLIGAVEKIAGNKPA